MKRGFDELRVREREVKEELEKKEGEEEEDKEAVVAVGLAGDAGTDEEEHQVKQEGAVEKR